ncbi:MAG: hypothetical protein Q9160_001885 [Pyrenula sp. 1 TL-2023]
MPEQPSYKPLSVEELASHHQQQDQSMQDMHIYQWHRDSGQGTERASSSLDSLCASRTEEQQDEEFHRLMKSEADDAAEADGSGESTLRRRFFRSIPFQRFLRNRIPMLLSRRTLEILGILYDAIDRLILILGFIAISTGAVTYGGIMNKDIVHAMDVYDLNAMFVFTVTMGFTAFLMAWETIVLAIKGWAIRKEINRTQRQFALSE